MEDIYWIFKLFLKDNKYQFSDQTLKERLYSDPDNEVLAISNTLDYLQIQNLTANVPKNAFSQLPKCFIAQLEHGEHSAFALIRKQDDNQVTIQTTKDVIFSLSNEDFLNEWNGFVIAIDENSDIKFIDKLKKILLPILTSIVCSIVLIFFFLTNESYSRIFYLILSGIGVGFSYLAIKEKFGIETITSRFCTMSSKTDCAQVINSKEAKILDVLDLTDLSIVYFSFLCVSFFITSYSILFCLVSFLTVPIIFYSIIYQIFIIKKLCPLCISIATILSIQFFVSILTMSSYYFNYKHLLLLSALFSATAIIWFTLKPIILKALKYDNLIIENLKFRRNYNLFIPYYNTLEVLQTDSISELSIKIGDHNGIINITAITNPLCKMCSEAHYTYLKLLQNYPDNVNINFLFLVPYKDKNDIKTKIAERLMQLYYEESINVFTNAFNDWYDSLDAEKWFKKWNTCNNKKYNELLSKQVRWCLDNEITNTPVLLVNGRKLPDSYLPSDLEFFMEHLIHHEGEIQENIKNIHA